jgi:hypothetical protein
MAWLIFAVLEPACLRTVLGFEYLNDCFGALPLAFGAESLTAGRFRAKGFGADVLIDVLLDFALRLVAIATSLVSISARALRFGGILSYAF